MSIPRSYFIKDSQLIPYINNYILVPHFHLIISNGSLERIRRVNSATGLVRNMEFLVREFAIPSSGVGEGHYLLLSQ